MMPHVSGYSYGALSTGSGSLATVAPTANRVYFFPFAVPNQGSYDELSFEQVGAGTPTYDIGIYGPLGTYPYDKPLLASAGATVSPGPGVLGTPVALNLEPGWYFLAFVMNSAVTVRMRAQAQWIGIGGGVLVPNASQSYLWIVDGSPAPLPANVPATISASANSNTPILLIRRS